MRILFDQGTPRPLRNFLPEHTVDTPAPRGWAALSNGELLDVREAAAGLTDMTEEPDSHPHCDRIGRSHESNEQRAELA